MLVAFVGGGAMDVVVGGGVDIVDDGVGEAVGVVVGAVDDGGADVDVVGAVVLVVGGRV